MNSIVINGHFRQQRMTGVQRYASEIIREFERKKLPHRYVGPPASLRSDALRQLWMQGVMPLKIADDDLLWSPTNIGPAFHRNQVVTLHDIADRLHPEWFDARFVRWRSLILPSLLKRVKGIITVSEFSRQTIIEKFPQAEGKVKVIYNGVRTDHFYPRRDKEIAALRKEFELHKPFVITVGSLDPRKNINGMLKAWNQLPAAFRKETELVVVGGKPHTFAFRIEEVADPSVRFLGYVRDQALPGLYSAAEAFIYPSLFEGFGLPVLEAMACRTPVVTSNTTSLMELAENHAVTVNPHEPEEIAEAVSRVRGSAELRHHLAGRGYRYAQNFQWSKAADETYEFLMTKGQE